MMDQDLAIMNKGVRCGNHGHGQKFYHPTAQAVRECYDWTADQEAQRAAEQAAEEGYERFLEDRGYWAARAQEDYEARNGIGWM